MEIILQDKILEAVTLAKEVETEEKTEDAVMNNHHNKADMVWRRKQTKKMKQDNMRNDLEELLNTLGKYKNPPRHRMLNEHIQEEWW